MYIFFQRSIALCLYLLVSTIASLKLNCSFGINSGNFYLCQVSDLHVSSANTAIASVSGLHQKLWNNINVTAFCVEDSPSMEFMPKAIDQFFPSTEAITVFNAGLKTINAADLEPFPNLRIFALENCKITSLESRLFFYNPKLITISFRNNQLQTIDDQVFDYIDSLEKLDLSKNVCIDKKGVNRYKVRQVIKEITVKCKNPSEGSVL